MDQDHSMEAIREGGGLPFLNWSPQSLSAHRLQKSHWKMVPRREATPLGIDRLAPSLRFLLHNSPPSLQITISRVIFE